MQTEELERRCPRLGGPVTFTYCRTAGDNKSVCFKILDCWWEFFDVRGFLEEHASEELEELLSRRKSDKITTLVDLIERARRSSPGEGR